MRTALTARTVPFFNYKKAFADHEDQYLGIVRDVIRRGAFIMQQDLLEFEQRVANYLGVRHAIGVGNATDGLTLAFRAAGLKPGDEVIFPSHTMVASPAAVAIIGGVPVPVECGPDHLIDPESAALAVTPRTRFLMPVQLNGRTANMDALQKLADRHGLTIVEDAAQGLGSRFRNRYAGSFGLAAAFSFYPAKVLGCFGDGGAVTTNDDGVAQQVRMLRDHGRGESGEVEIWGLNSRLDNLQAAILDYQFRDYQVITSRRRVIALQYQQQLGDLSELVLPPAPDADPDHFDVYQNYEIEAERRDELKEYLRVNGVGTLIQWGGKPVHQFTALGLKADLPVTDRLFTRCLMLPMNMTLTDDEVTYVVRMIRDFYGR